MTVLGPFLVNFKKGGKGTAVLYSDVVVFQYDSFHTSLVDTSTFLVNSLESMPSNVKNIDAYGWSLGNLVNRYGHEILGLGKKFGNLTTRIISIAGVNYGLPDSVAAGIVSYVGLYVPSLLNPPPITLGLQLLGGTTDNAFDPSRSEFMHELNDNTTTPFTFSTEYFTLAGNDPNSITPNSDSKPGTGLIFDAQYQALDGTLGTPASDAVLSIRNASGQGVLQGKGVALMQAVVPVNHITMGGLKSILGPVEVPGSGYDPEPLPGGLPTPVFNQLTAWLSTF